jgi:hypothetical protein
MLFFNDLNNEIVNAINKKTDQFNDDWILMPNFLILESMQKITEPLCRPLDEEKVRVLVGVKNKISGEIRLFDTFDLIPNLRDRLNENKGL